MSPTSMASDRPHTHTCQRVVSCCFPLGDMRCDLIRYLIGWISENFTFMVVSLKPKRHSSRKMKFIVVRRVYD